jgi:hypothetical protein
MSLAAPFMAATECANAHLKFVDNETGFLFLPGIFFQRFTS